jgi:protein-tyrosine phosphatase
MKIRRQSGRRLRVEAARWGKILRASRRAGSKDSFMDITWLTDRIAIGGAIWLQDNMAQLAGMGVTHVINMQSEFDDGPLADACGVELLWNAIDDDFLPKPPEVFSRGVEYATNALRQEGSKLYIHCAAGVHRAPMMTLALLCAQGMELLEAVYLIENRRPVAEFPEVYLESVRGYLKSELCPRQERRIWSR